MRVPLLAWVLAIAALAGCGSRQTLSLTAAQGATVQTDVRAYAQTVAHDVTQEGPAAWRRHFSASPSFFMAAEGSMAYPNSESATTGIQEQTRNYKSIDLKWGDDLRVDPLTPDLAVLATTWHEVLMTSAGSRLDENGFFTGVAEYREGHWQFRDVHWSWAAPAPASPAH